MTASPCVQMSAIAEVNPARSGRRLPPDALVSFIAMQDVSETGRWVRRQVRHLSEVANGYTLFVEGDVLFAKITPCMENGKGAHALDLVNGCGFGSTEFHVLRARPGASDRFVYHLSMAPSLRGRAEAFMTGSAGQRRVQAEFFDHWTIADLPLREQVRVAIILDTIDEAILKTEQVIAKLHLMKQGLLHDLLTRGIDENGELRDPERHPEQFRESELGRIPASWGVARVADVTDVTVGYVGPTSAHYTSPEAGVLFLRTGNIAESGISLNDVRHVTNAFHQSNPKSTLMGGDVVVSRVGDTGTAAVVPDLGPTNCANMIILRRSPVLDSALLRLIVGAEFVQAQIRGFTAGSVQAVLNIRLVERLWVPLPSASEQLEIAARAAILDSRISAEKGEADKMRLLKRGLMDDLLTGRVRVPIREGAMT